MYFGKLDNFAEKPKFCSLAHFRGKTTNCAPQLKILCAVESCGPLLMRMQCTVCAGNVHFYADWFMCMSINLSLPIVQISETCSSENLTFVLLLVENRRTVLCTCCVK